MSSRPSDIRTAALGALRRKRIGIPLAVFAVYTLFGFLALPGILRTQIVQGIRTNMKREARLGRVRVNPLLLSVTLEKFELRDPDGTRFVAFDRLFLDYQLSSIVRRAITFRALEVDSPVVHVRIMPDGQANFADLVPKENGPTPRLLVGLLQIRGGSVEVTNLMAPEPETGTVAPIDLKLLEFATIPRAEGTYRIAATDPGHGSWSWTGDLTLAPMHSAGVLEIVDSRLPKWWGIVRRRVPFEIRDGRFGCRLEYVVDAHGDSLVARVKNSSVRLASLAVRKPGITPDLLALDSLVVSGIDARYPEQVASIARVLVAGPRVQVWREPDSTLNWQALFAPGPASATPAPAAAPLAVAAPHDSAAVRAVPTAHATPPAAPWVWSLGELAIRGLGVDFEDRTTHPPFAVSLAPANFTVRRLSSHLDAPIDVQCDIGIAGRGTFACSGTAVPQPPAADLKLELADLPLAIFQPYVSPVARLHVIGGTIGAAGSVKFRGDTTPPDVRFHGRAESHGLVTRDAIGNERFLGWERLDVQGIDYGPKRLTIDRVGLRGLFAKVVVYKDRTTNLQDVLAPSADSTHAAIAAAADSAHAADSTRAAATGAKPAPVFPVRIGRVDVANSTVDFGDVSLLLPFAARIEQFAGHVTGLSSDSLARADVKLDGRMQSGGTATVTGTINPLAGKPFVDLGVMFHDLNMPVLTPYTGQYIGREVDKGKLSLDLTYKLEGRHLVGSNKMLLDQFELGKKVDSPEATKLPIGLAIAILKDGDGKIRLDVPVEGDVDDPHFRIAKVIWQFIMSLLQKVALSPFKLLGALIGGHDGDEMSHIEFAAGSAAPVDSLGPLAEALGKRPQLKLEVRGRVDSIGDAAALRVEKFEALANERLASDPKRYGGALGWSSRLLEVLFVERCGKQQLAAYEDRYRVPAGQLAATDPRYKAGSTKRVLDEKAFGTAIQDTLTALQPVDAAELLALANARGNAIRAGLVAKGVPDTRVYLLNPEAGAVENGRIRVELNLSD